MTAALSTPDDAKAPFDIHRALAQVREAVRPYPPAALFELAGDGHDSLFEVLVACVISIRTFDETTVPSARRLFALGRTPAAVAALDVDAIDRAIVPATFHEAKARQIHAIAQVSVDRHGSELPCNPAVLTGFHGVGPKCAHLALGIACGLPYIGVDVHVHRVTNRWSYVAAPTPERTLAALQAVLPVEYRVEINRLLVPFGKHVCTGARPRCSTCPVRPMCPQVGVGAHR